jgi:hypothetical protein
MTAPLSQAPIFGAFLPHVGTLQSRSISVFASPGVEGLDHLMHDGRRDPKEPTEVCFSRWHTVSLAVVVDGREVLALLGREPCGNVNQPRRTRTTSATASNRRAILCRACTLVPAPPLNGFRRLGSRQSGKRLSRPRHWLQPTAAPARSSRGYGLLWLRRSRDNRGR